MHPLVSFLLNLNDQVKTNHISDSSFNANHRVVQEKKKSSKERITGQRSDGQPYKNSCQMNQHFNTTQIPSNVRMDKQAFTYVANILRDVKLSHLDV